MKRFYVFVEGQTEETFVRDVVIPYFSPQGIYLTPIIVRTSATARGGVVGYEKVKRQVIQKCLEDVGAFVTTMFDLFRLPRDFPGVDETLNLKNPLEKAAIIEERLKADIGRTNFIPNIVVHEFEGLLFTDPSKFADWFGDDVVQELEKIKRKFESPEHVNDHPETAPSKRIKKLCPSYDKPLHGSIIATQIGLDSMRSQCRHFDEWLSSLSQV